MTDFNTLLNAAFDAAIEAKLQPLREQIQQTAGLSFVVVAQADGSLALNDTLAGLVKEVAQEVLEEHTEEYDHDDFVVEGDLKSRVEDVIDDAVGDKVNSTIDGMRVTLST